MSRICKSRWMASKTNTFIHWYLFSSGPLVLAPSSDADARRYVQLAKLPGWELVEEDDTYGKDEL